MTGNLVVTGLKFILCINGDFFFHMQNCQEQVIFLYFNLHIIKSIVISFLKKLLGGSHVSDQWNIFFHVEYIGDVNSY